MFHVSEVDKGDPELGCLIGELDAFRASFNLQTP